VLLSSLQRSGRCRTREPIRLHDELAADAVPTPSPTARGLRPGNASGFCHRPQGAHVVARRGDTAGPVGTPALLYGDRLRFHEADQPATASHLNGLGAAHLTTDLTKHDQLQGAYDALDESLLAHHQHVAGTHFAAQLPVDARRDGEAQSPTHRGV